jgi:uncharacterized protein YndB with AHSA1/START domain
MGSDANKVRSIITDKLVVEKTGRTMAEWFDELDRMGAAEMDHPAIFELVAGTEALKGLGQWNQNLLATSYEWDRGLKERGSRPDGTIEISVSKTVNAPVEMLYQALTDDEFRERWLPNQTLNFRKTTPNKSARITWSDGRTSLSVELYGKGSDKAQIVVQHMKLPDADTAAEMKSFWSAALGSLKQLLEARER